VLHGWAAVQVPPPILFHLAALLITVWTSHQEDALNILSCGQSSHSGISWLVPAVKR
jgi:hypothetical protein